ncbi:hypothetical protein [Dyella sp.]|uniref:hypothetical protein n=1 Tax=Dyella sp. TaxID=1869338 RepID=UPI0028479E47|nr:hypothetical protein [Dyella sp.]MDR3443812.1 hypothetical protein [Dyella sp.]
MHQIPMSIFMLGMATTVFFWAHIVFALTVRFSVRHDRRVVSALFASDQPPGLILYKSYQMRVKLFFPWVVARELDEQSKLLRVLLWSARLAGTGLIVAFLLMVGDFVYLASSGA